MMLVQKSALRMMTAVFAMSLVGNVFAVTRANETQKCPDGYSLARLHANGQRIEAGLNSTQAVTQHDLLLDGSPPIAATGTGNYVPFLACAQNWTDYERAQANQNLSTKPDPFPYVLNGKR